MRNTLIVACAVACALLAAGSVRAQSNQAADMPGKAIFATRCAACHGTAGNGGEFGPRITDRVPSRSDDDMRTLLHNGLPGAGMPPFDSLTGQQVTDLITFVRTLHEPLDSGPKHLTLNLTDSKTLQGLVLNQTDKDMQLLGDDHQLHLLRKSGAQYREVTSQTDWTTYNGQLGGSRYTTLTQINKDNVSTLSLPSGFFRFQWRVFRSLPWS